jgi:hypothetical protein
MRSSRDLTHAASGARAEGGARPTEADIGSLVWPIWRRFLDSDHTLKTLAAASQMKPANIVAMFLNPGATTLGPWGALAHGLGYRIDPSLLTPDAYAVWRDEKLGFSALGTTDHLAAPGGHIAPKPDSQHTEGES